MPAQLSFVLVNESTAVGDEYGGALTDEILTHIAACVELQLNRDIAPEWGGSYAVRCGAKDGSDVKSSEVAIWIKDSLPEAPGAAGYHATLPNGAPVEYIGRDGSNSLIKGGQALSVTISHECAEVAGDRAANFWADKGDGVEVALELSDAVESYYYDIDGVSVSDFLTRAFFTPGAPGPYSYLGMPSAPFVTANAGGGDYQLERSVDENGVQQVTARGVIPDHRFKRKSHWSSRSYRRGLRLVANPETLKPLETLPVQDLMLNLDPSDENLEKLPVEPPDPDESSPASPPKTSHE